MGGMRWNHFQETFGPQILLSFTYGIISEDYCGKLKILTNFFAISLVKE